MTPTSFQKFFGILLQLKLAATVTLLDLAGDLPLFPLIWVMTFPQFRF
jgi:hypothetical protein